MKTKICILILVILSPVIIKGQYNEETVLKKYFESITIEEVSGYSRVMTSAEFEGRLSGSPGFWKTANWIAEKLKQWGIEPAGDNGTYFQNFPNPYTTVTHPGSITLRCNSSKSKIQYSFPDDFYPGSNTASGRVKAEVVYVGYGISAPELGYDDYAGVDVKGKIVVFHPGLPVGPNHPGFENWVFYDFHKTKLAIARAKGAKGLLYIDQLANTNTMYQDGFVYAHIGPRIVQDLFEGSGTTLEQQRKKLREELKPQSLYLNKTIEMRAKSKHYTNATAANVIGIIEGSDPVLKNEVIIIGAHFDGQGKLGDLLFPSALDNASGTANIMAAARAIAQSGIRPARTIMFLFIGGHENGMYGVAHYLQNPVFQREKTIAFFNLDMVGNGTGISLMGGQSFPEINKHFEKNNELFVGRNFVATPYRQPVGRPRGDGIMFQLAGYTAFGVGTTGRVKEMFYHDHRDNMDTLTPDVMRDVARLLYLSLIDMANDPLLSPGN